MMQNLTIDGMEEEEVEGLAARLVEPAVNSPIIRVRAGSTLSVLSCTVRYLRHIYFLYLPKI
jgi:hypothetical protein